jgi:hypothetical protein
MGSAVIHCDAGEERPRCSSYESSGVLVQILTPEPHPPAILIPENWGTPGFEFLTNYPQEFYHFELKGIWFSYKNKTTRLKAESTKCF